MFPFNWVERHTHTHTKATTKDEWRQKTTISVVVTPIKYSMGLFFSSSSLYHFVNVFFLYFVVSYQCQIENDNQTQCKKISRHENNLEMFSDVLFLGWQETWKTNKNAPHSINQSSLKSKIDKRTIHTPPTLQQRRCRRELQSFFFEAQRAQFKSAMKNCRSVTSFLKFTEKLPLFRVENILNSHLSKRHVLMLSFEYFETTAQTQTHTAKNISIFIGPNGK